MSTVAPLPAPSLQTPRLLLRAWRDADCPAFVAMGQDARVMEFFPALQTEEQSRLAIDRWSRQLAERGWSNWAVERRDTGAFIGFVGLTEPRRVLPFSPCVEIGWRLSPEHWGQGFASEAARCALAYGFKDVGLEEIVSFTTLDNHRSQAVMRRIGMQDAETVFAHPGVPEGHPMRPHCLYKIHRQQWLAAASSL